MEGGAPGRPSPTPVPPPALPTGPGSVITRPPGGAEQTVPGPARTWGLATEETAPGASVRPPICYSVATLRRYILYTRTFPLRGLCR